MRVLVCGGRDYRDFQRVKRYLNTLHSTIEIDTLIEGGARGADTLARVWAAQASVPVETFPADWSQHGRRAGTIRNKRMLTEGRPDLVVAFPGGVGTADMVRQARAADVPAVNVAI